MAGEWEKVNRQGQMFVAGTPKPAKLREPMKPFLCAASGLLLSSMCTVSAAPLPKLIAHRGASHDAPENTLASFTEAWKQGADGVETDIYLTTDGKLVCIHDKTTKRTAGTELTVTRSSYEDLAKLDYGSWKAPQFKGEKIPLLEEVLDALPADRLLFIEIKDTPRIVEPLLKVLEAKKADTARVFLISFNADVIRACREKIPSYQAYLITALKDFEKPGNPEAEIAALEGSKGQGLLFKSTAPVTPEWIGLARGASGRKVFCWNVDEKALGEKMLSLGVDYMGTNRPAFVRSELTK
jgi:glycerophosphoryl diester phosphodiesterase